jgi:hypothetical protein
MQNGFKDWARCPDTDGVYESFWEWLLLVVNNLDRTVFQVYGMPYGIQVILM